jgi:hypothetical protein
VCLACQIGFAQTTDKFKQLDDDIFPTPNAYRTASGAPGHQYWQQRADYEIEATLDDANRTLQGRETITYTNNSPDELHFLWLQLDQNERAPDSDTYTTMTDTKLSERMSAADMRWIDRIPFDGGFKIEYLKDKNNNALPYTIHKTMMRVELPAPLKPKQKFILQIGWHYLINDRAIYDGRSGYEYFPKDDNCLYTIAQWYPRMCVYDDTKGWNNRQFLGNAEFALNFGDYKVKITVPADHIVAATGELQNPQTVLSPQQLQRWTQAQNATKPVWIVTEEEAKNNEKQRSTATKTWQYTAENVRDFAFASSRKFIWDAMAVKFGSRTVIAQSLYPKEGNPLWAKYSTEVVAHTLKTYSKYTLDYPYPQCTAVHADMIGMEYPMISFNFGRPLEDGSYSAETKYRMISVIIHEVGHNFFPMIINSDERHWAWLDEGINSFVEYLTEQEWERGFPSRRGQPATAIPYMTSNKKTQKPIMTDPESVKALGSVFYTKPAAALNILRETVMGRELFDYAFKEYARRWAFKSPHPTDFFRTMEDASSVDLDWFWRGWFYGTDHTDIAIESVTEWQFETPDPTLLKEKAKKQREELKYISDIRNKTAIAKTRVEQNPELADKYTTPTYEVTEKEKKNFEKFTAALTEREKQLLSSGKYYYEVKFKNKGGLVMPLIIKFLYLDGTEEIQRIPAEVWRFNEEEITKVFPFTKKLKEIVLDPFAETADADLTNNVSGKIAEKKIQLTKVLNE